MDPSLLLTPAGSCVSAGNRAIGKDRAAKGGSNPNKLSLPALTPAELEAFKKGIAG